MTMTTLMLEGAEDEDVAVMREVVLNAFCHLLHGRKLEPMTALGLAAMAVGSVYKEVAEAHMGPDGCPCGWEPFSPGDIAGLQTILGSAAGKDAIDKLFSMPALGHG